MSLNRSVPFRSKGRPARRVAAGAAVLALTLALAAPVQAAPGDLHGPVLSSLWSKLQSWLDGFLPASPGAPSDDGPVPAVLPEGCEMDPAGSTCEDAEIQSPLTSPGPESGSRVEVASE